MPVTWGRVGRNSDRRVSIRARISTESVRVATHALRLYGLGRIRSRCACRFSAAAAANPPPDHRAPRGPGQDQPAAHRQAPRHRRPVFSPEREARPQHLPPAIVRRRSASAPPPASVCAAPAAPSPPAASCHVVIREVSDRTETGDPERVPELPERVDRAARHARPLRRHGGQRGARERRARPARHRCPTSSETRHQGRPPEPASRTACSTCRRRSAAARRRSVSRAGTPCSSRPRGRGHHERRRGIGSSASPPRTGLMPEQRLQPDREVRHAPRTPPRCRRAPAAITPRNEGRANSDRSSSGSATRRSTTTKAARPAAATANAHTGAGRRPAVPHRPVPPRRSPPRRTARTSPCPPSRRAARPARRAAPRAASSRSPPRSPAD